MPAARLLFLPGAGGNTNFWRPLSERLPHAAERVLHGWPGFGGVPPRADVRSLSDLLNGVLEYMDSPVDLIAQSMGGVLAVQAALARPQRVSHLVLAATSGGLDLRRYGAHDWRADYARALPHAPDWFAADRTDLEARLEQLHMPVLLLWGDADPISPLAVGRRLLQLIPNASLRVVRGGDHDFAHDRAAEIAADVVAHLQT